MLMVKMFILHLKSNLLFVKLMIYNSSGRKMGFPRTYDEYKLGDF